MLSTFTRRHDLNEAGLIAKNARRQLHRQRDLLSTEQFNGFSSQINEIESAVRSGNTADRKQVEEMVDRLDKSFSKVQPAGKDAGWRENCEVLLVALVLAIGIRAYFLQPFKIPTGSMEPTLNGIIAHDVQPEQKLPGVLTRVFHYLWLGRTYADAVSTQEDTVTQLLPIKKWLVFNYTRIVCASGQSYDVYVPKEKLSQYSPGCFDLSPGRRLKAGETIIHGYVDTGDQVFVDKFTYNFRLPRREDVFVFSTAGITGTRRADMDANVKSEYYIKRLAGTPGDQLRIDYPRLFVNGQQNPGKYFERVAASKNGYTGYTNKMPGAVYLTSPTEAFTVPPADYFALGDNSAHSSDSRFWGTVPARNVIGRGLFVYYPFTWHWGPIH